MRRVLNPILFVSLSLTSIFAQQPQQLLKLARMWPGNANTQRIDCLDVLADGSYRLQRELSEWPRGIIKREPYRGKLETKDMEQLSALLTDPSLLSIRSGTDRPSWRSTPEVGLVDLLAVLVTRSSGKQFLLFDSSTGSGHNYAAEILPLYTTSQEHTSELQ